MRFSRLVAGAIMFAMLAGSCSLIINNDPWAIGSPSRPYYCDPTDTAINDAHGGGADPGSPFALAYTQEKGPLSSADCEEVAGNMTASSSFVAQFPTVADAEAAGWKQAAVFSAGQGVHYVDPNRLNGPFDPDMPNWLMYDGTSPSSQITGMMFLLNVGSSTPPAGFAGDNDHFHQHGALCYDPTPGAYPFIIGEHQSDAECAALGGVNQIFTETFMVHVWLPIYDGWIATDIFNKTHPSL